MRFSIWSAVSSEKQTDNASLSEQERKCRAVGLAHSWLETSGPYIIPGESRTRWVNLRDAENEIPALHSMLEDAKSRRFDLLTLYDYNRLRDLLDPVAKTLASYGVQIFSVNQPVEPLPVEDFNPYASDSESMMRGMSQIISRWQIADLRRKFRYGVTARVRKGLHSIRLPFGYRLPPGRETDKTAVAVQVPAQARTVLQIKDMFLSGRSYKTIARTLNDSSLLTPHGNQWDHSLLKQVLLNPFYAGKVFFGRTRTVHDPHHNTTRLIKNPAPLLADGLHAPLFTWDEHLAILAEEERRRTLPRNNRYPFSGLLECSICCKRLIHDNSYKQPVWHCPGKYHTLITMDEAFILVPHALGQTLKGINPAGPLPSAPQPATALHDLDRHRKRIQQAYESELYTLEEAENKIRTIDAQIHQHHSQEHQRDKQQARRQRFASTLAEIQTLLSHLPQWIQHDDPKTVNTLLLRLCHKITVTPDGKLTVHLQG
jgi:DNA invertase Pin-like site-specific DNA recombinase